VPGVLSLLLLLLIARLALLQLSVVSMSSLCIAFFLAIYSPDFGKLSGTICGIMAMERLQYNFALVYRGFNSMYHHHVLH
jgi:hypothetical protein